MNNEVKQLIKAEVAKSQPVRYEVGDGEVVYAWKFDIDDLAVKVAPLATMSKAEIEEIALDIQDELEAELGVK